MHKDIFGNLSIITVREINRLGYFLCFQVSDI